MISEALRLRAPEAACSAPSLRSLGLEETPRTLSSGPPLPPPSPPAPVPRHQPQPLLERPLPAHPNAHPAAVTGSCHRQETPAPPPAPPHSQVAASASAASSARRASSGGQRPPRGLMAAAASGGRRLLRSGREGPGAGRAAARTGRRLADAPRAGPLLAASPLLPAPRSPPFCPSPRAVSGNQGLPGPAYAAPEGGGPARPDGGHVTAGQPEPGTRVRGGGGGLRPLGPLGLLGRLTGGLRRAVNVQRGDRAGLALER